MISVEQALAHLENISATKTVRIPLADATGRVLSADVVSDIDSPPYDKSMMDGYALRFADLQSGRRNFEVCGTVAAGDVPDQTVEPGTALRIMTGAPIPQGADTIVVIEWTSEDQQDDKTNVEITPPDGIEFREGRHIMRRSQNIAYGQTVFQRGSRIRATQTGLLAEIGAGEVDVYRQPTAAVLPTGNEIVDCGSQPGPSQIRNSNGPMLLAMLANDGVATSDPGIGRDDRDDLKAKIEFGLQHDLLVLSGGVSAGAFDLVPEVLTAAGVEKIFHKVRMKPGKPVWFGVHRSSNDGNPCYVFGLPGNPVSSLVGYQLFVRNAIARLQGMANPVATRCTAVLAAEHTARGDRPTYWPGKIVADDSSTRRILPLAWQGSSDMMPLTETGVLICFPAGDRQYDAGTKVEFITLA